MGVLTAIFNTLIVLTSLFLICLILIQRGKGGGLAGAFGGVGGSSAFGTKAGDTFTKITVVTAAVWILMAMLLVVMTSRRTGMSWGNDAAAVSSKTAGKAKGTGTGTSKVPAAGSSLPAELPASSGAVPAIPPDASFPATPGSEPKKP